MGLAKFLADVLPTAGRKVDLRYYGGVGIVAPSDPADAKSSCHRRPLRIGVDVSSWIYKACQGYGDMLGDERHLTNYGRAALYEKQQQEGDSDGAALKKQQLEEFVSTCTLYVINQIKSLQKTTEADVLVILDGCSPPIKAGEVQDRANKRKDLESRRDEPVDVNGDAEALNRRTRAFRGAGAGNKYFTVVSNVIQALRINRIPFIVSPYEADGQLAYLSNKGYIDLVVTEDSDLVAHGATPVLYKLSDSLSEDAPRGVLLRREDLGACQALDLLDFSPVMLAVLFVAAGSDYCKKLTGIGIKTACNIVRESFHREFKDGESPLGVTLEKLFEQSWDTLPREEEEEYRKVFLSALLSFRHPIVYDPVDRACKMVGDGSGDKELVSYKPYGELLGDVTRRSLILGDVIPSPMATFVAEGWITPNGFRARPNTDLPAYVRDHLQSSQASSNAGNDNTSNHEDETNTNDHHGYGQPSVGDTQALEGGTVRSANGSVEDPSLEGSTRPMKTQKTVIIL